MSTLMMRRRMMLMDSEVSAENIVYFRSGDVGWKSGTSTSAPEPVEGRYTSDAIPIDGTVYCTAITKDGLVTKNNPRWNFYYSNGTVINVDYSENPIKIYDTLKAKWIRYRAIIVNVIIDRIEISDSSGNVLKSYKVKYID